MTKRVERHGQLRTSEEHQKLRLLSGKGMGLNAFSRAITRSEDSIKARAKLDGTGIATLR